MSSLVTLYSAGDCPVCLGLGAMFFAKSHADGALFLMCPHCGITCARPFRDVEQFVEDEINRFTSGVRMVFPTREEILAVFPERDIVREYPYEEWGDGFFEKYLAS